VVAVGLLSDSSHRGDRTTLVVFYAVGSHSSVADGGTTLRSSGRLLMAITPRANLLKKHMKTPLGYQ
jgi:hypothetical protein